MTMRTDQERQAAREREENCVERRGEDRTDPVHKLRVPSRKRVRRVPEESRSKYESPRKRGNGGMRGENTCDVRPKKNTSLNERLLVQRPALAPQGSGRAKQERAGGVV